MSRRIDKVLRFAVNLGIMSGYHCIISSMEENRLPPLIAICGPTASGKSALAMEVCHEFGGEIISADSRQVYKYMDIGTDKPSPEVRAQVEHHMVDLVYPDESFTLAMYQSQAFEAINDVLGRGKIPVLAGGTPLYVNSIIEGWVIPRVEPDSTFRSRLEAEAQVDGPQPLYNRLMALDPAAAGKILPTNTRRIIRALEVIEQTGRPMSHQQARSAPPYSLMPICLECDRSILYKRIDDRVDSYVERGLVDEVASLHERGYAFDLPAMSGIGYRQIGDYLQGRATLAEAIQRTKWDTHAFVRHQGNWFRRNREAYRIDASESRPTEEALRVIHDFLAFAPPGHGRV